MLTAASRRQPPSATRRHFRSARGHRADGERRSGRRRTLTTPHLRLPVTFWATFRDRIDGVDGVFRIAPRNGMLRQAGLAGQPSARRASRGPSARGCPSRGSMTGPGAGWSPRPCAGGRLEVMKGRTDSMRRGEPSVTARRVAAHRLGLIGWARPTVIPRLRSDWLVTLPAMSRCPRWADGRLSGGPHRVF